MTDNGRIVLVTGGVRGLGKGLVEAFANNGDHVITCGRNAPEPGATVAEFCECDVRDPEQVDGLITDIVGRHQRLDIVVNNAGGTPHAPADTMNPRLFDRVVALNLSAPFYVAQRANAVMQTQDRGGLILNIGSTAAVRPAPGSAPYVAAKAGLIGLTRALAVEWAPKVRVILVTPGLLRTELVHEVYGDDVDAVEATVPLGRLATTADIGGLCVLLASPAAAYVTGAELIIDGGGEEPAWLLAMQRHQQEKK